MYGHIQNAEGRRLPIVYLACMRGGDLFEEEVPFCGPVHPDEAEPDDDVLFKCDDPDLDPAGDYHIEFEEHPSLKLQVSVVQPLGGSSSYSASIDRVEHAAAGAAG